MSITNNTDRDFIARHTLSIDEITASTLAKLENDEGIIIISDNGNIIDIEAIWEEDEPYNGFWNVKIYKSYDEFCECSHDYYPDSVCMKDFTIEHLKKYMNMEV